MFSADARRALKVGRALQTDMCHVNGATPQDDPTAPFGRNNASGFGRFVANAGMAPFANLRWITIEKSAQDDPS